MKRTPMFRLLPIVVTTLCFALAGTGVLAQVEPVKPPTAADDSPKDDTSGQKPRRSNKTIPTPARADAEGNPISPNVRSATKQDRNNAAKGNITRKLNSIIIPRLEFREAKVSEAIEFLTKKSKELDPENEGISFVLKLDEPPAVFAAPPAAVPGLPDVPPLAVTPAPAAPKRNPAEINGGADTKITLSLNNVPLIEVIKYITNLANLKYKIEPFAVSILPMNALAEDYLIREWKVPAKIFLAQGPQDPNAPAKSTNAKDILVERGVTFSPGAFAMYSRASGTLVVKNTEDQLDLVERIVETSQSVDASGNVVISRVEFREATVSEATEYLLTKVPEANILLQANVRNIPVSFSLRNVTLPQVMEALQFTTGGQLLVENSGDNMYQISRNPQAVNDPDRPEVRIYTLGNYLGNKDEEAQRQAIAYLEDSLKSAVDMLRAADPGSAAQMPSLRVNPSTKLLIAVGRRSDLAMVDQLAMAVEGKIVSVPSAGGGGMGMPGMPGVYVNPSRPGGLPGSSSSKPSSTPRSNGGNRPPEALPGLSPVPRAAPSQTTPGASNPAPESGFSDSFSEPLKRLFENKPREEKPFPAPSLQKK